MTRDDQPTSSTAPGVASTTRRPWRKPELRRLGSVRELTLGGSKGKSEGGGTFKNTTGKM